MRSLVVGLGQIGRAVKAVLETDYTVRTVDITGEDTTQDGESIIVMNICFPYSEHFIAQVKDYIARFKPEHIIIWSTVPIGTTKQITGAVHSPVEGKHPDLELSIRTMERWIGANDDKEGQWFVGYFNKLSLKTRIVSSSDFTEALKLLSTTEYGLNIEFARYKEKVAEALGMPYVLTKEWNGVYNKLYRDLGLEKRFQKFILDSPKGPKGGHCVTPNARLLYEQYPDELVRIVGELE